MEQQVIREKILWTVFFILVLLVGFYAGRLSMRAELAESTTAIRQIGQISETLPTVTLLGVSNNILSGKYSGDIRLMTVNNTAEQRNGEFTLPIAELAPVAGTKQKVDSAMENAGPYVASKNSTLYHQSGTKAAKSIKPENRVYFASKQEAEQKGFRPGSDVK